MQSPERPFPHRISDWSAGRIVPWNGRPHRLLGAVSRGGMAEIFLAAPADGHGAPLVFKRLRDGGATESAVLEMFAHEAQIAVRIQHPNVAAHYGAGDDDGRPFLALEYVEGQTLAAVVAAAQQRNVRVEMRFVAYIGIMALRGLQAAHELKGDDGASLDVVHRDVCPRNLLVGYDGTLKLIDFGIAQSRMYLGRGEAGVVKGKPNYMSPEQATGRRLDRRADLFALGVVLWELLSGERFAGNAAPPERRYRLPYAPVPRVSDVRDDVDPRLDAIVAGALELDPARRYASASDLTAALLPLACDLDALRRELARLMHMCFGERREAIRRTVDARRTPRPTDEPPTGDAPVDRSGEVLAVRYRAEP